MKIREFSSYKELLNAHIQEINKFPIVYYFGIKDSEKGKKELKEKLSEIGVTSLFECVSLSNGGVIRNSDVEKYNELVLKQDKERRKFFENDKNLQNAIKYAMSSVEYNFSGDLEDVIEALSLSEEELKEERVIKAFKKVGCL